MARQKNKKSSSQRKNASEPTEVKPAKKDSRPIQNIKNGPDSDRKKIPDAPAAKMAPAAGGRGAPDNAPADLSGKKAPAKGQLPPQGGRVSMITFMAGMFLSLILGIYVGTLLPGLAREATPPETIPPVISATTPAQPPTPGATPDTPRPELKVTPAPLPEPQAPKGIHPKLAERIAQLESITAIGGHKDVGAWTELGNLYFDTDQPRKAINAYEHSLAIKPNNPDVLTDLGIMYREIHDFAKALECFRQATAINPAHANALFNEGVVLAMDLNNKGEAIAAWEKLLKQKPNAEAPDGKPLTRMIEDLRREK